MNKAALLEIVQRNVKEGFAERIEIVEQSLCELVEDTPRQQLLRLIEHMTDEALACHHKEERRWAYLTDCDRLDRAFAAMEEAGVRLYPVTPHALEPGRYLDHLLLGYGNLNADQIGRGMTLLAQYLRSHRP